jgi:carboxymethylenebutenolidase
MTIDLRNQADWLAREGFLAVAPDLFHRGGRVRCLFAAVRQVLKREGDVFEDLESTRAWMSNRRDCSGRVGVIGFCFGGGIALLLAGMGGYDASSVNYGSVPRDAMEFLEGACPIVGSYGDKDIGFRTAPDRLREILQARGIDHDVEVYADAGHSFLNDHDDDQVPAWAVVTGRLVHSAYHEPSAVHARRRIVEFFGRHLTA